MVEMLLKMSALGLVRHSNAYLASAWNWIDCVVVLSGLVTLLFSSDSIVGSLRLIRMLRPLRSIQRIRGMRVLVQCIIEALPQIVSPNRRVRRASPPPTRTMLSLIAVTALL